MEPNGDVIGHHNHGRPKKILLPPLTPFIPASSHPPNLYQSSYLRAAIDSSPVEPCPTLADASTLSDGEVNIGAFLIGIEVAYADLFCLVVHSAPFSGDCGPAG